MRSPFARAALTLAADATTLRVVPALRAAGIDPVLLKGPAVGRWLYATGTPRCYSDSDLLIAPELEARAGEVLADMGFYAAPDIRRILPGDPDQSIHATTWNHGAGGPSVDLHTGIPGFNCPDLWSRLLHDRAEIDVGGLTVSALDERTRLVHVVTHALQHNFEETGPNTDLRKALAQLDAGIWCAAASQADRLGASVAFAVGLAEWPEGRALALRIGLKGPSDRAVAERLRTAGHAGTGAAAIYQVAQLPTWRLRAHYIAVRAMPPSEYVRSRVQISGAPPYSAPLPMVYIRYWWLLGRKLPGAVRSWRSYR